jgi:hypothetical protein
VASSVLGLDVGFVTALIAPDNEIVPLLLLGVATLALEPLRAAITALAYQRARERWEGADLHAAISALTAEPHRRESMPPKAAARAVLLLLAMLAPTITHAEPPDGTPNIKAQPHEAASDVGRDASADVGASDERARERARAILARDEFLPSSMDSAEGSWRRWLAERMRDRELSDRDASAPPRFELRLPSSLLVLGSAALLAGVGFWLTRSLHRRRARAAAGSGAANMPTSDQRIAEATAHAQRAHYELGLRSLYAACLSALGRFDSAQTNGQVLQGIRQPPLKAAFDRFTQVLEPCCYGQQPATREDFEQARILTSEILRAATLRDDSELQP